MHAPAVLKGTHTPLLLSELRHAGIRLRLPLRQLILPCGFCVPVCPCACVPVCLCARVPVCLCARVPVCPCAQAQIFRTLDVQLYKRTGSGLCLSNVAARPCMRTEYSCSTSTVQLYVGVGSYSYQCPRGTLV